MKTVILDMDDYLIKMEKRIEKLEAKQEKIFNFPARTYRKLKEAKHNFWNYVNELYPNYKEYDQSRRYDNTILYESYNSNILGEE